MVSGNATASPLLGRTAKSIEMTSPWTQWSSLPCLPGLVATGTGFADLTRQYADLVKSFGRKSFEDAVSVLPIKLRVARAEKIKHAWEYDYAYDLETTYALVGCSSGRLRGAVFHERQNFEPTECDAWCSPYVDAEPETASAVLTMAQRQLTYVQRKSPDARAVDRSHRTERGRADARSPTSQP